MIKIRGKINRESEKKNLEESINDYVLAEQRKPDIKVALNLVKAYLIESGYQEDELFVKYDYTSSYEPQNFYLVHKARTNGFAGLTYIVESTVLLKLDLSDSSRKTLIYCDINEENIPVIQNALTDYQRRDPEKSEIGLKFRPGERIRSYGNVLTGITGSISEKLVI